MKRKPHFTVFHAERDGETVRNNNWYWNLKGGNGEIVCQSEGYNSKSSATRATKRLAGIVYAASRVGAEKK